jgi:ABC-type spermidine/putrescine transport system permease subunit I
MLGNVITDQFLSVGDIPFGSAIAVALMVVMALALVGVRLVQRAGPA